MTRDDLIDLIRDTQLEIGGNGLPFTPEAEAAKTADAILAALSSAQDGSLQPASRASVPTAQVAEGVVVLQTARGPIDVDASIAPIVAALNAAGVETIASCSGHSHRPGNIALRDGREIIIARDFDEGRLIDSLFPVSGAGESPATARARLEAKRRSDAGEGCNRCVYCLDLGAPELCRHYDLALAVMEAEANPPLDDRTAGENA